MAPMPVNTAPIDGMQHTPTACIYCLRRPSPENRVDLTSEHFFPEGLGFSSPTIQTCRQCNNETLSELDQTLIQFLGFIRAQLQLPGKEGYSRGHSYQSHEKKFELLQIGPRHIQLSGLEKFVSKRLEDGTYQLHFELPRFDFNPDLRKKITRSLLKQALGCIANKYGYEVALNPQLNGVRNFVLGLSDIRCELLVPVERIKPVRLAVSGITFHGVFGGSSFTYVLNYCGFCIAVAIPKRESGILAAGKFKPYEINVAVASGSNGNRVA